MFELYHGDCLEIMPNIPAGSVDLILTDPPYGKTQSRWDEILPFEKLWPMINGYTCLIFGSEPFSSRLRLSNIKMFKHDWIWKKSIPRGHLNAKKYPMRIYEIISVFSPKLPVYNPQMWYSKPMNSVYKSGGNGRDSTYGAMGTVDAREVNRTERLPQDVVAFDDIPGNAKIRKHPNQKPVPLLEYLIKTYTNTGDTVMDICMGSGSTGVAAINLGRRFIGIELDREYYDIAEKRITEAVQQT